MERTSVKRTSAGSSDSTTHSADPAMRTHHVSGVSTGRIVFLLCLAAVAAAFGVGTYFLLKDAEEKLAREQFDSISDRALDMSLDIARRQKEGLVTLASMAEQTFPDAETWPFINFKGYEVVANNLIRTSSGQAMGLLPIVTPEQREDFEEFASNLYPEAPYDRITGLDPNRVRYNETDGTTYWGSPYKIFTPFLYHSFGTILFIANYHSLESRGRDIDEMIRCTEERAKDMLLENKIAAGDDNFTPQSCSYLTDILDLSTSTEVKDPAAVAYQPIYPANEPSVFAGFISSAVKWVDVLVDVFSGEVTGVDCVLETDTQAFTYYITNGEPTVKGKGDLHDPGFSEYGRTITLIHPSLNSENTPQYTLTPNYTLTLYPRSEFFDVYATSNPVVATVGAVCVIVFTSALFLLYDLCVRKEFNHQKGLSKAKKQFVRFISHEVRTPLNSVCIGLQLLQDEAQRLIPVQDARNKEEVPSLTEEQQELKGKVADFANLSEDIHHNAISAVDVLNDLLNYDKVESGTLQLEFSVVEIWDLIQRTYSEFQQQANFKNIDYMLDFSPLIEGPAENDASAANLPLEIRHLKVVGDKARLSQVMRNLISNALKFTPEQGKLAIRVDWKRTFENKTLSEFPLHSGEQVSFLQSGVLRAEVTDTGAGMSRDQLKNLFREGVQFNVNRLQAGQGSGLGLYIAKGILAQHGGSLTAASQGLGCGTTFTMEIPLYYVPDEEEPEKQRSNYSGSDYTVLKSLTILIVDDATTNRKFLRRLLQNKGHVCDEAENGLVAIQQVKDSTKAEKRYDSILMDFEMPEMDGPTATKELRAMGCDAFIAGITGNCFLEEVSVFKKAGANIVLPKPLEMHALMNAWLEYGLSEVE